MDLKQVRADGDAVQTGQLAGKDAALQPGVDNYIRQEHLVGGNGVFRKFLETGNVRDFIL